MFNKLLRNLSGSGVEHLSQLCLHGVSHLLVGLIQSSLSNTSIAYSCIFEKSRSIYLLQSSRTLINNNNKVKKKVILSRYLGYTVCIISIYDNMGSEVYPTDISSVLDNVPLHFSS